MKDLLSKAGLRSTKQRVQLLEALSGKHRAITAQELHSELYDRGSGTGLATVYRTLTALAEVGLVDTFASKGEQSFKLCSHHHHHHLVCESCGCVEEIDGAEVETWVTRVTRKARFKPTGHTADIYGICASCR